MSIERNIERIADALEIIAGKVTPAVTPAAAEVPAKPKAVKAKPAPAPEPVVEEAAQDDAFATEAPATQVTAEDVRAALVAYSKKTSQAEALKLLAKHGGGADRIPALKPEFYAAVVAAANK